MTKQGRALVAAYLIATASAATFVGVYFANNVVIYTDQTQSRNEKEYSYDPSWNPNDALVQRSDTPITAQFSARQPVLRHQPPNAELKNNVDGLELLDDDTEIYLPISSKVVDLPIRHADH